MKLGFANEKTHVEEIVLRRMKACVEGRIAPENLRMDSYVDHFANSLAVRLTAYVWGKIDSRERHEYPETWWDAVKVRWFPKWARRRWPPRMVKVEIERGGVYPMLSGTLGTHWQTMTVMRYQEYGESGGESE